ncbi:hypothetical protein ACFL5Q_06490, partial [Planctomycetota bacterium]
MHRTLAPLVFVLLSSCVGFLGAGETKGQSQSAQEEGSVSAGDPEITLGIGGCGGVYFLAEPGELIVDVEKRDRNLRGRQTELRAILVGPDRRVLQQATIPDDGKPRKSGVGPPGRVRLAAEVKRKGVYGLNVTVSQDRYGDAIIWGFQTNCPHYLIETARGHRDQRREEPIVLLTPERSGNVCFLPRKAAFGMEITNLPDGVDTLSVYDASDTLVHALPVEAGGRASHTFPADVHREAVPWRLSLPAQQATVQIDGVTRWEPGDLYANLPYWTPDPASFFPFQPYRWLLTPYSRTVYGPPGQDGELPFQVHNNSDGKKTVQLEIEFPDGQWPARLSAGRVVLGPNASQQVTVRYTAPAENDGRVCHVRATPVEDPDFSTYSTLTVKAGTAPASEPREIPLVLKPYEHENEQFGYLPDYPVENQVYFDLENRPFVRTGRGVETLRAAAWSTTELKSTVTSRDPPLEGKSFGMPSTKIAFDHENNVYLVATAGGHAALLSSTDAAKTFSASLIPDGASRSRSFDIEQFTGHNVPHGPPPIVRYTR